MYGFILDVSIILLIMLKKSLKHCSGSDNGIAVLVRVLINTFLTASGKK